MKLSKILLASSIASIPLMTICPTLLTSCNNKKMEFEAYSDDQVLVGSETVFDIHVKFSYTPKHKVGLNLMGQDLNGLFLVDDEVQVVDNQAVVQVEVKDLWISKTFNFGIEFTYDAFSFPYVLEGFQLTYDFVPPVDKDLIRLVGSQRIDTTALDNTFLIQFSNKPAALQVETSLQNVVVSDNTITVTTDKFSDVVDESGKYYLYFTVMINEKALDLPLFITSFDIHIEFVNSLGQEQSESIIDCLINYYK
ncbi:MAG: hypothetical protein KBS35_01900 [Mycoplasma sp.]|nr:hypothetical protein [Candidatus Hennigella equi]